MNGKKVIIRNPPKGEIRKNIYDSILIWPGTDTFAQMNHPVKVKRGISTVINFASEDEEVAITIKYGITNAAIAVRIEAGDYKLEKVNGIWYSVPKIGSGETTRGANKINPTGVELRIAWPSTFK